MNDAPGTGAPSPSPAPEPTQPTGPVAGGSGLPENVAGALSYLLGALTGVVFFIIDRERPFVRFHAVQSIGITIAWVVIVVAEMILSAILGIVPVIGWIIGILLSLGVAIAGFGIWLWLMYQAYQGRTWELPFLGPHVRRIAAETGGQNPPPRAVG
ncbi:MAG TPA: DUF4870 domain-containing protein [Longimicrobiales bacterium]|nr:DUF4870 domain-containing protein [Longimicrobiales bacterium]